MADTLIETFKDKAVDVAGGPARLQVIAVLAGVLALATADRGAISAVSDKIEPAFGIGNTEFGLLLAVVSFATAVGTLPMGVLVDRVRRRRVLIGAMLGWIVAMILCGAATSYLYLLIARLALGAATAAAWPCVASLTGDFFPARDRASVYGLIVGGEFVGVGIGFLIAGEAAAVLDWRWAFFTLAALCCGLVVAVWRLLPEPARGAQSWLRRGETDPDAASRPAPPRDEAGSERGPPSSAQRIVRDEAIEPREALVLHEDPTRRNWLWAMRYCLRIPSYRLLVAASSLAYYFLSGASAFGMIFFTRHYGVSHSEAAPLVMILGLGALAGVISGGRLSRRLLRRGRLTARITLPAIGLVTSVPLLGLGIWTHSLWLGILLLTVGAASMSMAVAPLDAARLDIVHPRLWGRAEAGRMALRSILEGAAPLLFGAVSEWLGGGDPALTWTFLIMLAPMAAAAGFAYPGRRTYPRDVATAAASIDAVKAGQTPAKKG